MAGGIADKERYPWDPPRGPATSKEEAIRARANTSESGIGGTSPVGMYPLGVSQPFELMDLAGNVWEWTANLHDKDRQAVCCAAARGTTIETSPALAPATGSGPNFSSYLHRVAVGLPHRFWILNCGLAEF